MFATVLLAVPLCAEAWQHSERSGGGAQMDRRPEGDRGYGRQPDAGGQYGRGSRGGDYARPSEGRSFDYRNNNRNIDRNIDRNRGSGAPEYREPRQFSPRPENRERPQYGGRPEYRERPGYGQGYSGFDRSPQRPYQERSPQAYSDRVGGPAYPSGRQEGGRPEYGGRQPYPGVSQPYPGRQSSGTSPYAAPNSAPMRTEQPPVVRGEGPRHGDWLRNQMRYPADEQERRLEQDPYYRSLPTDRQIELRGRLKRFNALPPEQRQRVMDRMEMIQRMPPEQQQHAHELFQQFRGMDSERKDMVRRTLRQMRTMPPDARERFLNSPTTQTHFSPEEMQMLRGFNSLGFVERER